MADRWSIGFAAAASKNLRRATMRAIGNMAQAGMG